MTGIIADTFFEIHRRNPQFWRMLAWENLNGGRSLRGQDWESIRGAYIRPLEALYRSGQAKGVFRPDVDFNTYVMLLFSVTYFYYSNQVTMSRLLNLRLRREDVRRQVEAQFFAIMNDGMAVPGSG
jgi:TetR/AcrR family transcriptional regulator